MFIPLYIIYLFSLIRVSQQSCHDSYFKVFSEAEYMNFEVGYPEKRPIEHNKCDMFDQTFKSPFVVFILYKTSGRFMGMGAIIDSKTVITSEGAIKLAQHTPTDMLVLAGFLNPWWGKNSQVRRGHQKYANEYELVLLEIKPKWNFNKKIQPIQLQKLASQLDYSYKSNYLVYGIPTSREFSPGDEVSKVLTYSPTKHTPSKENDCGKDYLDLTPSFNKTTHFCLFPNGTLCAGCVGSPVIGVRKNSLIPELAGVVLRSSCTLGPRQVLALNITDFVRWIKFHSSYGNEDLRHIP